MKLRFFAVLTLVILFGTVLNADTYTRPTWPMHGENFKLQTQGMLLEFDPTKPVTSAQALFTLRRVASQTQPLFDVQSANGTSYFKIGYDGAISFGAAGVWTFGNESLHILDTNATHDLIIKPGSNLTADRIFTIITGDAARSLTLSGNPTLSDWFDQSTKTSTTPTFAGLIIPSITSAADFAWSSSAATNASASLTGKGNGSISMVTGEGGFTVSAEAAAVNASIAVTAKGTGKVDINGGTGGVEIHEFNVVGHTLSSDDSIILNPTVKAVGFSNSVAQNLLDPTSAQDAATKNYVDSRTSHQRFEMFDGLVNTGYDLLDSFEVIGNWVASDIHFTVAADAVTYRKGTGSLKLSCDGTAALNDAVNDAVTHVSENWTGEYVGLWANASIALDAGDAKLKLVDGTGGTQYVNFPALTATTWTYVRFNVSALTRSDTDAWGFAVSAAGAAKTFDLYVDNGLRYDASGLVTLKQIPLYAEYTGAYSIVTAAITGHSPTEKLEDTDFWTDYTNKQVIFVADESTNTWFLNYNY